MPARFRKKINQDLFRRDVAMLGRESTVTQLNKAMKGKKTVPTSPNLSKADGCKRRKLQGGIQFLQTHPEYTLARDLTHHTNELSQRVTRVNLEKQKRKSGILGILRRIFAGPTANLRLMRRKKNGKV